MKIKAKFPGKCRECGAGFERGDEIVWTRSDGACCLSCAYGEKGLDPALGADVSDDFLKGVAAAVEMSTETHQRNILHKAVGSATKRLGVVPDLREGMNYQQALSVLQGVRALCRERKLESGSVPTGEIAETVDDCATATIEPQDQSFESFPPTAAILDSVALEGMGIVDETEVMDPPPPVPANTEIITSVPEKPLLEKIKDAKLEKFEQITIVPVEPKDAAVESKPLDIEKEDDEWLSEW